MRCFNRSLVGFLAACCVLLVVAGCAQKFTRARFDMIQPGVDEREDVKEILGKPEAILADVWYYEDLNHHKAAQIFFADDGRVLGKEWMDADTGEWDGKNPYGDAAPEGEVREEHRRSRKFDD